MRKPYVLMALSAASLCGCGGAASGLDLAQMSAVRPMDMLATESSPYSIGPGDMLQIRVLQVEDLSFDEIVVDSSGNLQMPLIGAIRAAGLTPNELSAALTEQLATRYLRNPEVSVSVKEAASLKVTIDGAVAKPGVYEMRGRTTLLQAIAMAEGPTRIADLSRVAVFRRVEEGSMAAVFDVASIRNGQAIDPVLRGDDIVVVDTSRLSARMQDILQAAPALASFFFYTTS